MAQGRYLNLPTTIACFASGVIVALGVPIQFYNIISAYRGEAEINTFVYLFFLTLCIGLSFLSFGFFVRVVYKESELKHRMVRDFFDAYDIALGFFPSSLPVGIATRLYASEGENINPSPSSPLSIAEIEPEYTPELGSGFIYVMRRADGVYKLGRSINPPQRLAEHIESYKQNFEMVRYFAVSNMVAFEKMALSMTKTYAYKREKGRKELRKMSKKQLSMFLADFERAIKREG